MVSRTSFFPILLAVALYQSSIAQENSLHETVEVRYVNLTLSALNKQGKYITDLKRSDIELKEDGAIQEMLDFSRYGADSSPRNIAFLVDNSFSMHETSNGVRKLDIAKAAVTHLLNNSGSGESIALLLTNYCRQCPVNVIDHSSKVAETVSELKITSGITMLYDRIGMLISHLAQQQGRRFLVVFSDGVDNGSKMKKDEMFHKIHDADVTVITVGTTDFPIAKAWGDAAVREAKRGKELLKELSEQTGGAAYFPRTVDAVSDIPMQLQTTLTGQYFVSYKSTNTVTTGWRKIEIKSRRRDIEKMFYRKGYFAD